MKNILGIMLAIVAGTAVAVSAGEPPVRPVWMDTLPGLQSDSCSGRFVSTRVDIIDNTVIRPFRALLRPSEWIRSIGYRTTLIDIREAGDLNQFGEVQDSTFFVNRLGKVRLTEAELKDGALDGIVPTPPWVVDRIEDQSPVKISVVDHHGVQWELLFDHPSNPELATGAHMISSRILWAAGYFVRPSELIRLNPKDLKAAPKITWVDRYGTKQEKGPTVPEALRRLKRDKDGTIRAVAVMRPPGNDCGPFPYASERSDDPNSYLPNQHRRSLRGLRWFAAWLNYIESSQLQTRAWWIPAGDEKQGFVVNFLEGLDRTLGSNKEKSRSPRDGHGYYVNTWGILRQMLTLGLYKEDYEDAYAPSLPGYGYFDSLRFRPETWRGYYPNPAFENATELDGYWAARILSAFRTTDLEAIIGTAGYSDPRTREEMLKTLVERRDKITAYLFRSTLPVDNFRIEKSAEGNWDVRFTDLAVDRGLVRPSDVRYKFLLRPRGLLQADIRSFGGLINRFIDNDSSSRILIDFDLADKIRRYPPIRLTKGPIRWQMVIVGRYGEPGVDLKIVPVKIPQPADSTGKAVEVIERFDVPAPEGTLQSIGDRMKQGYERTVSDTVRLGAPRGLTPTLAGTQPPPVRLELLYDPDKDELSIEGWSR